MERFRGNDDLAGLAEKRFKAAGELTDLLAGWSQKTLGQQPGYAQLRQFLDVDFRRDLKNAGAYFSAGQLTGGYYTNATEEFCVRFGQHLEERGYFKPADVPNIIRDFSGNDSQAPLRWIARLVASKMGVPETEPVPAALAFLADENNMENSLSNYLAGTDEYHAMLKQWDEHRKLNPDAKRPDPEDVMENAGKGLLFDFNLFGNTPDHMAVRLTLPAAPAHSNGRWDAKHQQEVWESDIEDRTNQAALPFTCYANWARADEAFQTAHLGKVFLTGDELTKYCLSRFSLNAQHSGEWDAFVAGLKPDPDLMKEIDHFRFSDETNSADTNGLQSIRIKSDDLRELLKGSVD